VKPLLNLRNLFLLSLAAWVIFNLIQTFHYVWADYSQIPVEDYWRIPQLWANPHAIRWSNFWQQHNEHRIIFPELVHVTDMLLLRGRMVLPIAVSGLCYLGIWCVLAFTVYSQKSIQWPAREAAVLLAAVIIAWKGCSTVIATPFQLQFTMLQVFSVLSLLFLSLLAETTRSRYLAAVIAAGAVCTYSSGNGMLMWIILIAAALFLKIRPRQILILAAAAAIFAGAYFFHYRFLPSLIKTNIRHPLQAAAFLCSYFSMPFGGYGPRTFGFKVGAANLLCMSACALLAFRRGLLQSRVGIVVFGSYLFILLSALLTTAGRMDLNDYLFAQAKAWRYVTLPTASWALLAIVLVWIIATVRSPNWSLLAAFALAVCFFLGFRKDEEWVEGTRLALANGQITATMLRNGVFDPSQVRTIFPDTEFVRANLQVLQKFSKSIYARGQDKWIGGDLRSLPLFDKQPVYAKIKRVVPVPGGLEIFGWADVNTLTDDHEILFVDGNNVIVGFGRRPAAGLPENLGGWDTPNPLAFVGYVSLARPIDQLSLYVRTYHGKAVQPVGQTVTVPSFSQLDTRTDSAPIPGVTWIPDSDWTLRGYQLDPQNGPAPPGQIYASWSGSAAKTGTIHTAPFPAPASGCLILPVLPGTASYGQSVQVRDADTSQVIADIPFLDGRTIWQRWRIPIPASAKNVAIFADDEGTGPNQWVAVAAPEQCQ
jgi:hypothetical protein